MRQPSLPQRYRPQRTAPRFLRLAARFRFFGSSRLQKKYYSAIFRNAYKTAVGLVCSACGAPVSIASPEWRFAGYTWQHSHGHPIGHVDACPIGEYRPPRQPEPPKAKVTLKSELPLRRPLTSRLPSRPAPLDLEPFPDPYPPEPRRPDPAEGAPDA